jgi:hypothetical protein
MNILLNYLLIEIWNMNKLILLLLLFIFATFRCKNNTIQQKNYTHSLEIIAAQHKQHFQPPQNTVTDTYLREMILRECLLDTSIIGERWIERNNHFIIQKCYGYPNRYIIADTSSFMFDLMDVPLKEDTIASLKPIIAGKYLGELIDNQPFNNNSTKKIIMNFPYRCWIEFDKVGGYNYSYVTVLYEMKEQIIRPIEILDFKCSDSEELDRNPGCFCKMNRNEFKKHIYNKIILSQYDSNTIYGAASLEKYSRYFKSRLPNTK